MAGTKKFTLAVGTIAVVAAAAWFGANYYAKTQIEEKLNAYLVENDIQNNVTWGSLDASILGNASLHDVKVVRKDDPAKFFTIKNVTVHDLQTGSDDKKVDFAFSGLADETGNSPFRAALMEKAGQLGYDSLPLLDGRVKGTLNEKQDTSDYDVTLNQPEVGNINLVLKADKIVELVNTVRTREEELKSNPLLLISALSPVTIRQLNVKFDDAGLMPRVVKVQQGVAPVEGKPTAQQKEAFDARLAKSESDCRQQAPTLGIADPESVCTAVSRFMKNEAKSLNVLASPNPPLQLMTFVMQTQMGNPQGIIKAVQQLNLKVTN